MVETEGERIHQPWDDALQSLVRANPEAFIRLALEHARFKQQLPRKLKTWKLEVDGLVLVTVEEEGTGLEKDMLVDFEFQTYNDPDMPERLLRYNVLTRSEYKLPVLSCVIHLLSDSSIKPSPLHWAIPTGRTVLDFHYEHLELGQFTPEYLLQLGQPGLLPLLPFTKGGASRKVVETMFTRLEATGSTNLIDAGALLASLVFKKENPAELNWLQRSLRKMHDILREAPLYQEILQEGREEGLERGLEQGLERGLERGRQEGRQEVLQALRETLLSFVQARFPSRKMIRLVKSQAALIEDPEVLRDLILKVGLAQTVEEAQQHLIDWPDTSPADA